MCLDFYMFWFGGGGWYSLPMQWLFNVFFQIALSKTLSVPECSKTWIAISALKGVYAAVSGTKEILNLYGDSRRWEGKGRIHEFISAFICSHWIWAKWSELPYHGVKLSWNIANSRKFAHAVNCCLKLMFLQTTNNPPPLPVKKIRMTDSNIWFRCSFDTLGR